VFEGGDHVGLEVVPAEAELLLITLSHFTLEGFPVWRRLKRGCRFEGGQSLKENCLEFN
jgi:hypothetical protein